MRELISGLRSAVIVAALVAAAGGAAAATIEDVQPREFGAGDLVTITGTGLDLPGGVDVSIRFKEQDLIWLNWQVTREMRLRTVDVTAGSVTARVVRAPVRRHPPMKYSMTSVEQIVLTARRGGASVATSQFSLVPHGPDPAWAATTTASPGELLTIAGTWFGAVRGTVTISGRKAAVVSWAPDSIVVRVPTSLGSGVYGVTVRNPLGEGVRAAAVLVPGSLRPPGRPGFDCRVGAQRWNTATTGGTYDEATQTLSVSAMLRSEPQSRHVLTWASLFTFGLDPGRRVEYVTTTRFHLVLPVDLTSPPEDAVVRDGDPGGLRASFDFTSRTPKFSAENFDASIVDWTVVLRRDAQGRVYGEFSGIVDSTGRLVEGRFLLQLPH